MSGNLVQLRKVEKTKYVGTTTKIIAIVLTPFAFFFRTIFCRAIRAVTKYITMNFMMRYMGHK